jgi:hypothetical protein
VYLNSPSHSDDVDLLYVCGDLLEQSGNVPGSFQYYEQILSHDSEHIGPL